MNAAENWRALFVEWPDNLPKRGVILSTLNEAMPFKSFMLRGEVLLLERANPDALGSRFIMLTFDAINSVKFTDPLGEKDFTQAGFIGKLSK